MDLVLFINVVISTSSSILDRHVSLLFCSAFNCYFFCPAANGLKLLLDIQEEEYIPSNDLDGGAADAGIRFMIHDPTEPPYIKEYGISASPGQHVFVSMKHEKVIHAYTTLGQYSYCWGHSSGGVYMVYMACPTQLLPCPLNL